MYAFYKHPAEPSKCPIVTPLDEEKNYGKKGEQPQQRPTNTKWIRSKNNRLFFTLFYFTFPGEKCDFESERAKDLCR